MHPAKYSIYLILLCLFVIACFQEVVLSSTASSYSMAQLTGSTEYNVQLQAIAGAQKSRHVGTVFTTSKGKHQGSFWVDDDV